MEKHIKIGTEHITYTLRKKKGAKYLRLAVLFDGALRVTAPWSVSQSSIERLLCEKSEWLLDKLRGLRLTAPRSTKAERQARYAEYKPVAQRLVEERLSFFNQRYQYAYRRVNIRDQKTRWGSCSSQQTLSFNYRLALLPSDLVDYVVVHELCHLREPNHSARFWTLVAEAIPDYRERRTALRKQSLQLI